MVYAGTLFNQQHLQRVLKEYLAYYNQRRPHQGLAQDSPFGLPHRSSIGMVQSRNILGGIIKDYFREAA